jgi:hypothetical protein
MVCMRYVCLETAMLCLTTQEPDKSGSYILIQAGIKDKKSCQKCRQHCALISKQPGLPKSNTERDFYQKVLLLKLLRNPD